MSKARWSRYCFQRFLLRTVCKFLPLMLFLVLAVPRPGIAQKPKDSGSADSGSKPAESPWLSLDYTGSLFGYYRIEPDEDPKPKLRPSARFLEEKHERPTRLLLGMGDNFSPEFGASIERRLKEPGPGQENSCYLPIVLDNGKPEEKNESPEVYKNHKNVAPEILYKDSGRVPNLAECDNVARFLMEAGYRALVPGKEDFIYSAVWLRRIALTLQAASGRVKDGRYLKDDENLGDHNHCRDKNGLGCRESILLFPEELKQPKLKRSFADGRKWIDNNDHQLLMLAANLRWNFMPRGSIQGFDENVKDVDSQLWFPKDKFSEKVQAVCPLMFTWNPPNKNSQTCVPGGDQGNTVTTEMDWLRRLDVAVVADPSDCKPQAHHDPDYYCFPVARAMNMRAQSDSTFRRQLLKNTALIAVTTLSDEIPAATLSDEKGEKLRAKLEKTLGALSKDEAFDKPTGKEPQLNLKDKKPLEELEGYTKDLDAYIQRFPESDRKKLPESDLKVVLCAVRSIFEDASKKNADFLFSLNARKAAIRLLLRKIAAEQEDVGYTIVNSDPMSKTLVIGVIGQETMKAVSPGNLKVCTTHEGEQEIDGACGGKSGPRLEGTVVVGDPLLAVTTVLRAAWVKWHGSTKHPFDKVVVMAQMPRTQAEELAAHAAASLKSTACSDVDVTPAPKEKACPDSVAENAPHIDLILSEAQTAHTTPKLKITYTPDVMIPVIAPKPAWLINQEDTDLIDPVSTVTITDGPDNSLKRTLVNSVEQVNPEKETTEDLSTMAELLHGQLQDVAKQHRSADLDNLENLWGQCAEKQSACQDSVVAQYLLEQIQRSSQADVVFLEHRDFYFGPMLGGYGKYEICKEWADDHESNLQEKKEELEAYCRLRIALDRILWKGDYSERVMVDGKTLKQMLAIARQRTANEQALSARDTVEEWLITFGIVTHPPENLSTASMGSTTFTIPGVAFCTLPDANTEASEYCVNDQRLTDDGAYFVATSDHLAGDKQVYGILQGLDTAYHKKLNLFITREIADEIFRHHGNEASHKLVKAPNEVEEIQQKRPILQVDFAKWVAGFMVRSPNQSDTALAANFSGVTDSRATTPSAQELDLEAIARMTTGKLVSKLSPRLRFGIQSDLEYDRAVTGSLTGTPPVVTYALNSFTSGGFVQFRLHGDLRPRLFLVVAPYQYQTQITGNFLNFSFTKGTGQITVPTPRSEGFSHRLGLRYELGGDEQRLANKLGGHWADSYVEAGPEYSNVNEVLSGLLLPNGSVCAASATVAFTTCVANQIMVASGTVLIPQTETLHTGGLYWDMHLQFTPNKDKRWSLALDTKGDDFVWPGARLLTQSRYAFTTTEALNFKVIGNLLFAPTYSQFFYRNQGEEGESHSLVTKTFSVVAKWYFARDAAVPFWRQLLFLGPASADQTKSAKMQ